MSSAVLQAKQVSKVYQKGEENISVLQDLDFEIPGGKTFAIMGESGVGKSTLLQILGGLLHPSTGEVLFEGKTIFNRGEKEIAAYRNFTIGFIFQFHYLLPEFSALENVTMPMRIAGKKQSEFDDRAKVLLEKVGLSHRISHRPSELSGGEQQRVAIVRALVNSPKIVLADEPTGNLDSETAHHVSDLLLHMVREQGMSLVIATHSETLASRTDKIFRLKNGRLDKEVRVA